MKPSHRKIYRRKLRKALFHRKRAELTSLNKALAALKKHRGMLTRHPRTSLPNSERTSIEYAIKELRTMIPPLRREVNQLSSA